MPHVCIIRRTEKIRLLREMLRERGIVYLSSFFYSGKTVLLDQFAEGLSGPVLRFDCGRSEDFGAFLQRARESSPCVLLVDDLHLLSGADAEALSAFLYHLPEGTQALLSGRAQQPLHLQSLCARGIAAQLKWDFLMFSDDEIQQLFLEYGIPMKPSDIVNTQRATRGWVLCLQIVARKMLDAPGKSLFSFREEVETEIRQILLDDVVLSFSEEEKILLYNLSPFLSFTEDMARIITGRTDAPRIMNGISQKSHILIFTPPDRYHFPPFVQQTLFREMQNRYSGDYINGQYKRAALYYELQNMIPKAISYYVMLKDTEKIRELLIQDTRNRPSNGDLVELKEAYALLPGEMIHSSPELMKGICMLESLKGHPDESERWYQTLKQFSQTIPPRDSRCQAAEEAIAYLDIGLAHRGTRHMLNTLVSTAKLKKLTFSKSWISGFNVAGNSVSLLNGGADFSRWIPHGWTIYRMARKQVESALGLGGEGIGDIAVGESEFESNLTGDYTKALDRVCAGLSRVTDDLELRCAAVGIQSRIIAAQGNAGEAMRLMDHLIDSLPGNAPPRLRQNLTVHRLYLQLLQGETQAALSWLEMEAPDETKEFIILDRYRYLLKLRLYIILRQWEKTPLLCAQLRNYFDRYDRPFMRAQLHFMQAVIDRRTGRDSWREEMEGALRIAKKYRMVRVAADEGIAIMDMLNEMKLPDFPWENAILRLNRTQAVHYPHFLLPITHRPIFTDREYQVYSLLIAGYKNAKIASILHITERTVKHYTSEIYRKLHVTTRAEAVNRAAELGDI